MPNQTLLAHIIQHLLIQCFLYYSPLREKGVPCAKIAEILDRTENAVRIFFGERSLRYKLPDRKPSGPWMDNEQIIREWRQAKDPDAQMLILAELNDVPLPYIQKIIREGT